MPAALEPPARRGAPWRRRVAITGVVVAAVVGFALTPSWGEQPVAPRLLSAQSAGHQRVVAASSTSTDPNIVRAGTVHPVGGSSERLSSGTDHSAPVLSNLVYTRTVYPVRDGFRDTFWAAVTTNERTAAKLTVRDAHGKLVRSVTTTHGPGRFALVWDGRTRDGHLAGRGTYHWSLLWHDGAGNSAYSAEHSLRLSHRYLVTRTARTTLAGDAFWRAGGSDPSCSRAGRSHYRHGVLLSDQCSGSIAAAFYRIAVPSAVSTSTIAVEVDGDTSHAGTRIYRAFGAHGGSDAFAQGTYVTLPDTAHRLWSFGSARAAGLISRDHHLVLALSVDSNPSGVRDLDIGQIRTIVGYRVLN